MLLCRGEMMKIFDIALPVMLVIALAIIYFLWGCKEDWYLTIVAVVVIIVTAVISFVQNKKMKKLSEKNK